MCVCVYLHVYILSILFLQRTLRNTLSNKKQLKIRTNQNILVKYSNMDNIVWGKRRETLYFSR